MKKTIIMLCAFLLFTFTVAAQSITVTSPNGGENWKIDGPNQNITWTTSGITSGTYRISLFNGTTNVGTIASGIPYSTHSFNWVVGNFSDGTKAAAGSNYKIKVRLQGETPNDFSNSAFTISLPMATQAGGMHVMVVLPDLECGGSSVGGTVYENREVKFVHYLRNKGKRKAATPKIWLKITGPPGFSTIDITEFLPDIAPESMFMYTRKFIATRHGTYKAEIVLNPGNVMLETKYINNFITWNFSVQPLPDLIVCVDNNLRPKVAYNQNIRAYVKNIGHAQSDQCKLSFYLGGEGTATFTVLKLDPGEQIAISRSKKLFKKGTRAIKVTVDSAGEIPEIRENNNYVESFVKWVLGKENTSVPAKVCSDGTSYSP